MNASQRLHKKIQIRLNSYLMNLDLSEHIQNAMAAGNYEPTQTHWVNQILRPGSRFVDVGANVGHFAGLASKLVGTSGRVFAFEPSPIPSKTLREMIDENHIQNMILSDAAVGDSNGHINLFLPPVADGVHSPSVFNPDLLSDSFVPHSVPMITLDSYAPLNDGIPIDLIKIDVEGFEPNVIAGMQGLIKKGLVRHLICEFNSGWLRRNNGTTPTELLEMILQLGFSVTEKTDITIGLERNSQKTFEWQDILFSFGL